MKTWEEDGLREVLEWHQLWGAFLPERSIKSAQVLKALTTQHGKKANWVLPEPTQVYKPNTTHTKCFILLFEVKILCQKKKNYVPTLSNKKEVATHIIWNGFLTELVTTCVFCGQVLPFVRVLNLVRIVKFGYIFLLGRVTVLGGQSSLLLWRTCSSSSEK
jgi:hypothetical protein